MTFVSKQLQESDGNILLAVVDETYGMSQGDAWDRDREAFRLNLEEEHRLPFEDGNIGPGADLPAFITLIQSDVHVPLWVLLSSMFFLGEPLTKNFDAWRKMGQKIRSLLTRPTYLNRQGAAVLAVDALFHINRGSPKSLRLIGYRVDHIGEEAALTGSRIRTEIMEAPDTLYLGYIRHVFEIEADGVQFRVSVKGCEAEAQRLS